MKKNLEKTAISRLAKPAEIAHPVCCVVASAQEPTNYHLDGNLARRDLEPRIYWDDELTGFGLRVRTSGSKSWIVKYQQRGNPCFVTLGATKRLDAIKARSKARKILAGVALDGLPTPQNDQSGRKVPTFSAYFTEFWNDYAHHWKPSTRHSNKTYYRLHLKPAFGRMRLDEITRADVVRWRDDLAGKQGTFNRAVPVLSIMLSYAEKLGYRPRGSNPSRGIPRYKRQLPERYLSPGEYRRLGRALDQLEQTRPLYAAAFRLLALTGARRSEITQLRWEWVQPPRLMLPDSKTDAKVIWLSTPALEILESLPKRKQGLVFPSEFSPRQPIAVDNVWNDLRRKAALPDVRLHDLRHSFASVAIAENMPLSTIGKLLGHALPETTARYAHLADEVIADAAERICSGLAEALEGPA